MDAGIGNTFYSVSGSNGGSWVVDLLEGGTSTVASGNIFHEVTGNNMAFGLVVHAHGTSSTCTYNTFHNLQAVDCATGQGAIVALDTGATNNYIGKIHSRTTTGTAPLYVVDAASGATSNIVRTVEGDFTTALSRDLGTNTINITPSRALVSDTLGRPVASGVTDTQLGYLGGATPVTSSVQAQINALGGGGGGGGIPAPASRHG